jgi:hypothetical protein
MSPTPEAAAIYHAIFGRPIPPIVERRFTAASALLDASVSPAELDAYRRAIAGGGDLEALELAARYTRRLPLLSRKFRLMAYLAETLPENQGYFVNERSSFLAAVFVLAGAGVRTGWKMARGLWLVRGMPHG